MALLCLFVLACAGQKDVVRPGKGVYHPVKKGETLWQIARAYGVNQRKLAEANKIQHPDRLEAGRAIFIPDAVRVVDLDKIPKAPTASESPGKETPKKREEAKPAATGVKSSRQGEPSQGGVPPPGEQRKEGAEKSEKPEREKEKEKSKAGDPAAPPAPPMVETATTGAAPGKGSFAWPVRGRVASRFGRQPNGMVFNHIRIATRDHAQIVAAASGTVIFSAPLRDFGETVIIKHEDHFATVYTHLGNRSVRADSRVKKGEIVGQTGKSGKKGEGCINFELRRHNKALDPLLFLP